MAEEWGNHLVLYLYDADGSPIGMQYRNASYGEGQFDTYWFEKNLQGDVVAVYNQAGTKLISYTYDAWGNSSVSYYNSGASTTATYNPFRYRGYYLDSESGFYYLNSRYYDPAIGRFITADKFSTIKASSFELTDKNLYAYCDNNPVTRTDDGGAFWETVFDVVSLAFSVVDVVANPTDPRAWISLAGDAVDLIPFVTGVGEVTRGIKTGKRIAETADDLHDAAKVAKKAPIVVGENMNRVKKYAEEIGAEVYKPWKNDPWDFDLGMKRNKRWIKDKMREGREIIDIGPDFARRRTGYGASPFYEMERTQLKGYSNYKKVFTRSGKFGGLFNEW